MSNPTKLSIIMPVYQNEKIENYIRKVHKKVIKKFKELKIGDVEFIIAEDGSKDNTRSILRSIKKKYNLTLNLCNRRRGYVKAVKELHIQAKGEYIFLTDSDGESDPNDFWKLWGKIQRENLDAVIGYKKNRRPYYRLIISKINSFLIGILFGVWLKDTNCGFRIIKKGAIKKIIPLAGNLSAACNAEHLIIAKELKHSYGEVPVKHFYQKSAVFSLKKIPITLIKSFFELFKLKFKILKNDL